MYIELNTAELSILHDAVHTLLRNTGCYAMEEDSHATGAELEAKLTEALKNARVAAKAATLATV
jgi:hypothetical protein